MVASMGPVAVRPASAAAAAFSRAGTRSVLARRASRAGYQASSMVFSPASALPRRAMPLTPAPMASVRVLRSRLSRPLVASAMDRKKVPYRTPDAPPTLEISVMASVLRTASGVSALAARASTAAAIPRLRLAPWSASPIAASSSVRARACSVTRSPQRRTQARRSSAVSSVSPLTPRSALRESRASEKRSPSMSSTVLPNIWMRRR